MQYKILFGYILLMIIIGCMAAVLFHERHRIHEIEEDANAIRLVRREINNIHRHITDLALSGESVMAWEQADYESYHEDRLDVDILLQDLQRSHGDFVLSDQIDTLRNLLEDKETHLLHIMEAYHRQEIADSLLLHRLPVETERVTSPRTITQKKKGIAGFFGKKETVQVPPSADAIRSLNERLITIQEERIRNIDAYSDSLQLQNKELNRKLHMLINTLNNHTQEVFSIGKTYRGITRAFHPDHNRIDYSRTHPAGNLLYGYSAGSETRHEAQAENGGNNKQEPRTAGDTQEYHPYHLTRHTRSAEYHQRLCGTGGGYP